MTIRRFQTTDTPEVAQLFHDTIHQANAQDYTPAQLQAWAPDDLYFQDWEQRCLSRITLVAVLSPKSMSPFPLNHPESQPDEAASDQVIGFAELEESGHIGCFYTHWQFHGQGVGRRLLQALEDQAMSLNVKTLRVEVSITARPFFEHLGFATLTEQQVFCRGAWLTNFRMLKQLLP